MKMSGLFSNEKRRISPSSIQFFAKISLLLHLLILFTLIEVGLQFDENEKKQQKEYETVEGVTTSSPNSYNGITNLADVSCGKQLARKPKIIGGSDTYHGEFPWLVSIKEKQEESNEFLHFCGGTILNRRYVMTAAHCFQNYIGKSPDFLAKLRVTIGEYDLAAEEIPINSINIGIQKLTIHPNFNIHRYTFDLAILRLQEDIEWGIYAWPACLANDNFDDQALPSGDGKTQLNATVAGWGSNVDIIGDQPGEFPNILQKTIVPILSNSECQSWFHHKLVQWSPKESHLCAGYAEGGFDSCRGDSGGPLMIQQPTDSSDVAVIGIVAAGKGCGRPFLPGVYTRVSKFLDWITQNVIEVP